MIEALVQKNVGLKKDCPLSLRVPWEVIKYLDLIAEYELLTSRSELVRSWVLDNIGRYRRNPRFNKWLRIREKRMKR